MAHPSRERPGAGLDNSTAARLLRLRTIAPTRVTTILSKSLILLCFSVPAFRAPEPDAGSTSLRRAPLAWLSTKFSTSLEQVPSCLENASSSGMSRTRRAQPGGRRWHAIIQPTDAARPPSFDGKGHIAFDHTSRRLAHLAAAHLLDCRSGLDHRTILESPTRPHRADEAAR